MEQKSEKLNIDEFIKLIACPLTCKIFLYPIIADDGIVYEEQAFLMSSVGNKNVSINYTHVKTLKSFIESFIDKYPEYKKRQYVLDTSIKIEKQHCLHNNDVLKLIELSQFDKIKQYINFDFKLIQQAYCDKLLKSASEDVFKYIIDNLMDINADINDRGWSFLNLLCYGVSKRLPNVVKYAIEKGGDILHFCKSDNWYPLHQIVHFSGNESLIKWGIDKHLMAESNLYVMNKDGDSILYRIFLRCNKDIINYVLEKLDTTSQTFKDNLDYMLESLDGNHYIATIDRENIKENVTLMAIS